MSDEVVPSEVSDVAPKVHGGPSPSEFLMKACELLDDLGWHDYERVLTEVGKVMPPGQAMRRNEQERMAGGGPAKRKNLRSPEALIRSGKRSKARETLWGKDYFEHREIWGVRQIRLIYLPPRVVRERSRIRAHRLFVPTRLADEIGTGVVDPPALLGEPGACTFYIYRAIADINQTIWYAVHNYHKRLVIKSLPFAPFFYSGSYAEYAP